MTYFLPSSLQKRILRYALSRLELLDTDGLDLEKLDIVWGKRSTVELREVGVHLTKLSALLRLPPSLVLAKASILLLRITVPADLYKSGISVELEGVEVRLQAGPPRKAKSEKTSPNPRKTKLAKGVKADRPRSTHPLVHDPGGLQPHRSSGIDDDEVDELSDRIPTTADLAQSFLHAEPQGENDELQAAMVQSQDLEQSETSSETGKEASGLGIGNGLSLPGFLAEFLRGVANRVQVRVRNVKVEMALNLDLPSQNSIGSDASIRSEAVTVQLSIKDVDLHGVSTGSSEFDQSQVRGKIVPISEDAHRLPTTGGIRKISLYNVQGMLLSDASVFAHLSHLVVPSSPEATQTSSYGKTSSKKDASRSQSARSSSNASPNLTHSTTFDHDNQKSKGSLGLEASMATSDGGRFADAGYGVDDGGPMAAESKSSHGTVQFQESLFADSLSDEHDGQFEDQILVDSDTLPASLRYGLATHPKARSSASLGRPGEPNEIQQDGFAIFQETRDMSSRSHTSDTLGLGRERRIAGSSQSDESHVIGESRNAQQHIPDALDETFTSTPGVEIYRNSPSSPPEEDGYISAEDLAQSKIFSHEEAESMYMSAMSHASDRENGKGRAIPGSWDISSSDGEEHGSNFKSALGSMSQTHDADIPLQPQSLVREFGSQSIPEFLVEEQCSTPKPPVLPRKLTSKSVSPATNEAFTGSTPAQYASSQGSDSSSVKSENSSMMAKSFMSVDFLVLKFPIEEDSTATLPSDHSTAGTNENSIRAIPEPSSYEHFTPLSEQTKEKSGQETLVEVGSVELVGDVGLTQLTIPIMQQLMDIFDSGPVRKKENVCAKPVSNRTTLNVQSLCWKFVDLVRGFTATASYDTHVEKAAAPLSLGAEVLLTANLKDIDAVHRRSGTSSSSKLSMRNVTFGYDSDNILSFDSGLKIRESTRDILAPVNKDIVLTITKNLGITKFDCTTLPIHVSLDLRRLDETFGWFGGFSSMLGLGNSMMSTVTIVDLKTKSPPNMKPSRGVHFETSAPPTSSGVDQVEAQKKITARIGGLVMDLQGTSCAVRLEGTAMKIVSRVEGLGAQVDRVNFSGPYIKLRIGEPSIIARLANIRLEYLSTPKEVDLARLLALLSPSKDKYERDDDILLDTLLRQRRQGAVIRITIESFDSRISEPRDLDLLPPLVEELKKLSTVTKYLPEDDRPGILTLGLVRDFQFEVCMNGSFGAAKIAASNLEAAHVTLPSLLALSISTIQIRRNQSEELLGEAQPESFGQESSIPMIMGRFVGNEMEPIIKIKLQNIRVEYHVSAIMAVMRLSDDAIAEGIVSDMISSVITFTDAQQVQESPTKLSHQSSSSTDKYSASLKVLRLDMDIRDSIIGLNPRNSAARGLVVLTNTHFVGSLPKEDEASATLEIQKASLMVIDDIENVNSEGNITKRSSFGIQNSQVQDLSEAGYVSVGYISSAKATLNVIKSTTHQDRSIDVEISDDLFVLETCADSTQTLQGILSGLKPPMQPSTELKYRTEVIPVEDMLASLSGNAFSAVDGSKDNSNEYPLDFEEGDMVDDEVPQNLEFVSSFYNPNTEGLYKGIADSMLEEDLESLAVPPHPQELGGKRLLESVQDQYQGAPGGALLDFQEDHFGASSAVEGTAHRWNTKQNTYGLSNDFKIRGSPLRVRVRDVHIIWNLFDGYDWQHTRDTISQAVADVENKAIERLSRADRRRSFEAEEEEDSVIGDFLFNSIYIGIPANRDPKELSRQVNRNLDDLASEAESYATSTSSNSPSRQGHKPRVKGRKLRLNRSKYHKMTFELKGVSADLVVFPTGLDETQSSIDVRVRDLEIFDHVPTSTWKKFATYMHDAGERESESNMIHLEILNVKPVPTLAASEIILKATILPLRLHVDQDALDFLTRFFEFKDESASVQGSKPETPFLQRVEVNSVRLKLDFKPKRVDYAGLRSGHTTEFMNFFILDRADMVLRHVIIYGVSGFDKLGKTLNDIWMPDVKRNQLPGVLAGLAPVRSLVSVGGGVRDLVVVPIREYRKDGRVVRSLQKGALAFAKTTTSELVKLGAKLAIGTQTVLQGAEVFLSQPTQQRSDVSAGWQDAELEDVEEKQISLYADQPVGVMQGLRGAYASLERDLLTAKDAIVAMPGEVMESGTAGGAARAVLRGAPTVILRPAMGVTKAVGQTLMGATNSLDPGNRRRIEDKYKKH